MIWLLLWLLLGLAGYCVMAFRDVLRRIEQVAVEPSHYDRVNYTTKEFLKGLAFGLLLGPITIVFFYMVGDRHGTV